MDNVIEFPNKNESTFKTVKEALQSVGHFYALGEAKSCGIVYSASNVTVRTPKGMGKFNYKEWNRAQRDLAVPVTHETDNNPKNG